MGNDSLCTFAMQQVSLLISLIVLSSLHTYAYRYVSRLCHSPLIRSKIRLLDSDPVSFEVATSSQCESGCGSMEKGSERSTFFLVDVTSDPTPEELSNQNLIRIVNLETSDEQTNELCWKCLGYRYNPTSGEYNNDKVFPKWRQSYPTPPDVIGVTRSYDPVVDKPVRDASMALMRSIPRDFKGGVRNLEKDGFRGFKLSELTPNKTRRAQVLHLLHLKLLIELLYLIALFMSRLSTG